MDLSTTGPTSARRRLAVAAAPALAVLLMLPGLSEPYGGFLGFSEAWYTLVAQGYAADWGSLLLPQVSPGRPDFNIPPLFSWLLHLGFRILGPTETTARLVAIAGAVLTVLAVGRLAGAPAALLTATTPAFVLLGRNVQPDTWSTALTLWSYAVWRARPGRHGAMIAGALFGLAIATKPTVLLFPAALAALAVLERRGLGWIERRHLLWGFIATLPTLGWTVLQLILHRDAFTGGILHGGGAFEWPTLSLAPTLAEEFVFAGFPLVCVLAPLALVRHRSDPGLRPALATLALGGLSFLFIHYHGYYLVAFLPAAAIVAARLLRDRPRLLTGLLLVNSIAALVMLGGHKLGRTAVADLARQHRGATFLLAPPVYDGYWTLFALYGRGGDDPAEVRRGGCAEASDEIAVVTVPAPAGVAAVRATERARAPVVAGYGIGELPRNPHRLGWGPLALVSSSDATARTTSYGFAPFGRQFGFEAWVVPSGVDTCRPPSTSTGPGRPRPTRPSGADTSR